MPRRTRRLTPEEAELWRAVARTTRQLDQSRRETVPDAATLPQRPPPLPDKRAYTIRPPAAGPAGVKPAVTHDFAPDPLELLEAAPLRIDRRRFDRMMRGKLVPEARLDLHGLTRDAAHAALVSFVLGSQARGHRLVLVITGKGRPDHSDAIIPERQGVLRHSLPHWLNAPPLMGRVLEVRPAHRRHGGGGAVYLYLRRRF